MSVDNVLFHQRQLNVATSDCKLDFAAHRKQVMSLLLQEVQSPKYSRIALLGVGNGNDIDFEQLARHFENIELVDIDKDALKRCTAACNLEATRCTLTYSCVDLADGVWRAEPSVGVTASLCLFSQIVSELSPTESADANTVAHLREIHLEMLLDSTTDGGQVVFVCDLVSAVTAPELWNLSGGELAEYLSSIFAAGNYFTGTSPLLALQYFENHNRVKRVSAVSPWKWTFGKRCYAVYAIVARLK
jgi:hypothetical protein